MRDHRGKPLKTRDRPWENVEQADVAQTLVRTVWKLPRKNRMAVKRARGYTRQKNERSEQPQKREKKVGKSD